MVCRVCACSGLLTSVSISIFAAIYAKIAANLNTWENYQKPTQFEDAMVRPRAGSRSALCRLRWECRQALKRRYRTHARRYHTHARAHALA